MYIYFLFSYGIIALGAAPGFLRQKRILRVMLGISHCILCHGFFKKHDLLTFPLCIFKSVLFPFNSSEVTSLRALCQLTNILVGQRAAISTIYIKQLFMIGARLHRSQAV